MVYDVIVIFYLKAYPQINIIQKRHIEKQNNAYKRAWLKSRPNFMIVLLLF